MEAFLRAIRALDIKVYHINIWMPDEGLTCMVVENIPGIDGPVFTEVE